MKKALAFLAFGLGCLSARATPLISELATPPPARPTGVPAASDVTMRSLRFHPKNRNDPQDTFKALADFHVTRLEWTYIESGAEQERAKIARVKAAGCLYGGATSGHTGVPDGGSPAEDLAMKKSLCLLDIAGRPIVPDFQKDWKGIRSSGCVNNPAYRGAFLANCLMQLDAGTEILQRDEASGNHAVAEVGAGCYCPDCIRGFRDYLKTTLQGSELAALGVTNVDHFDYAAYLRQTSLPTGHTGVDWSDTETSEKIKGMIRKTPLFGHFERFQAASMVDFYRWLRSRLDAHAGRRVPMSCNNTSYQNWERPYYREFDFALSELMVASAQPARIYECAQRALALGKIQVFGTPKTMGKAYDPLWLVRLRRQVIATAYASGGLSPVPWDCFEQTKGEGGGDRYFGKPGEYADLFAFVRANDRFLDRYGTAGAFGPGIPEDRYGQSSPLILEGENRKLYAFLRAIPGSSGDAVVIHLVDWNEKASQPAVLKLRTAAFFGNQPLDIQLRTPKPFDAAAHTDAEEKARSLRKPTDRLGPLQSAAYEPLVQHLHLDTTPSGEFTRIELPPLDPWGILVVTPKR